MWQITVTVIEDGTRIYTVSACDDGNEVRFTTYTEKEARELRDVLNRLGSTFTAFAI